ncbi:MAG: oxygen-dependent coproporphyrinogen oxidase [Ignavibacteriales bacterium]|nr:oxygen-dependent coproporphyrinogen oxidase [Ignavibacteriales bacterium]
MPLVETIASRKVSLKLRASTFFKELQETICAAIEGVDGQSKFTIDRWTHPHGGGGDTRIIENGGVLEKGGVNFSDVSGQLSERLARRLKVKPEHFRATGISLVLHPYNPMIPTVHCNLRYLELENEDRWFGGGMDLTPYYLNEQDVIHFHSTLKKACDKHDSSYYPRFKKWCDEYFFIKHRSEGRGVGGIFFDDLREKPEETFSFVQDIGNTFLEAYIPIVNNRRKDRWGDAERQWQLHRRGRYAEFNLVYDRGTLFGLETEGRVESILMSLPPAVQWKYNVQPKPDSPEVKLLEALKTPKDWL